MSYLYHITYSCYTQELKVLLNGKRIISSNSTVLQYMNEPLYRWCNVLPELLYREIGEDYSLIFTGREIETKIIKKVMEKYPHCIQMSESSPQIMTTLQKRMIDLSQLIRENQLTEIAPIEKRIIFVGNEKHIRYWKPFIEQIKIQNQYCALKTAVQSVTECKSHDRESIYCYFVENRNEIGAYKDYIRNDRYVFFFEENKEGFIESIDNCFLYGISENNFYEVIFECMLLFPLAEVFSEYAHLLMQCTKNIELKQKIQLLLSIKPIPVVYAKERIEVGKSVSLETRMQPSRYAAPEFVFESNPPGVVSCTQHRIYGEKIGKTKVNVYEKGVAEPFTELFFEVYQRNRITSIELSEHSKTVGVGDSFVLECTAYPADADNFDKIRWDSDREEIATVSSKGRVIARSAGNCKIFCTAEKIFSVCQVNVKPYMKSFKLLIDQSQPILLTIGEKKKISAKIEPANAIDEELIFCSDNVMVVNVLKNELIGIADGEANIIVENVNGRFRQSFHVIVEKGKHTVSKEKKKKFFGLF